MKSRLFTSNFFVFLICLIVIMQFCCPVLQAACSGTYQYGANNNNYTIPDDGSWAYSTITISEAPAGATVTCVEVHYEIVGPWVGLTRVDLTDWDLDREVTFADYLEGDLIGDYSASSSFDGEPVNQTWILWANGMYVVGPGYIDEWGIKVYYEEGGGGGGYCIASTTYTNYEYISRVQVGDINKSSGSWGYADYTAYSTDMQVGLGYGITVNNGDPCYPTDQCGIWVDWNQDEDFEDAGETISVSGNPGVGPYSATITPPGYATLGETRMRVRIVDSFFDPVLSPCGTASYGEVEDYTIEVVEPQYLPGGITGSKFNDLDSDGIWDGAEDGIQGWEIYLDLNDNGQYDTSEPNVITDIDGFYEFTDLAPDTSYIVAEIGRPGWQQTFPAGDGTHTIVIDPNEVVENVNFGNIESGAIMISGYVLTAGDDPIEGVLISGTNSIGSTVTDENGYYELIAPTNPWSGQITPSKTYWIFIPDVYGLINVIQDTPFVDFEGTYNYNYGGGQGTVAEPYLIYTPEQMNEIGVRLNHWDAYFKLMADIDLSGYTGTAFNIIGNMADGAFTGWFNGNGHKISNFTYNSTATDKIGLFGHIDGMLTIVENLTLLNPDVNAGTGENTGSLIGHLSNTSKVVNCRVIGGNVSGLDIVGGLVGLNEESSIENCSSSSSVSGRHNIGGLAGYIWRGGAVFSYANGSVEGTQNAIGGLVGLYIGGTITDCYALGSVSGNNDVGGLVGYFDGFSWSAIMRRCYSAGSVSGSSDAGGLIGDNNAGSIFDCFWDTQACLPVTSSDGGTGQTTAEMKMQSTFTDAGWDFVGETVNGTNDVWNIWEGAYYPRLAWENPLSGDFNIDKTWMYQSLPGQTNSELNATVSILADPFENTGYTYQWEFVLPDDVSEPPTITDGGTLSDPCCTFAAPSCDQPAGMSDSGQALTVRVTVTGNDFGNTGIAEAEFGIALLGDVNNDKTVNVIDRSIVNAFWRLGSAGPFSFTDCNLNCDTDINVNDRSIANAVWRGILGQNSVTCSCPLR